MGFGEGFGSYSGLSGIPHSLEIMRLVDLDASAARMSSISGGSPSVVRMLIVEMTVWTPCFSRVCVSSGTLK